MLLSTMPVMLWVITVFHLIVIILSLKQYSSTKNMLFLLTALVAVGLFYDALVLAIGGVIRFTGNTELTPGWANIVSSVLTYGAVAPLIIAGIAAMIKKRGPFMFLAGFFMFAFSALGPATGNFDLIFYISMWGEVLMILFLFINAKKQESLK